ncbi:MAG: helix-turn-helix transcriptional regulator [Ferruginibacter sp.]|nr:helix-turn-helix transcriptional regulator [Cytophagales bacterium]
MSTVSENIKYLRRVNGLTQEQFARRIGIKRSLLGAYEEARANPNLSNLMNIAKIFGTSVDNLLKNDIRKLRETQSVPLPQPSPQLLTPAEEPSARGTKSPKPLASILEKYYQESGSSNGRDGEIRLVAQRIVPNRVTPLAAGPALSQPETPAQLGGNPLGGTPLPATVGGTPPTPRPPVPNPAYQPEGSPERFSNHPPVAPDGSPPVQSPVANGTCIELVRRHQTNEYLLHHPHPDYLRRLPTLTLPWLPAGHYRAFETGDDFAFPGAVVIGSLVRNWYDLQDGHHYLVVLPQKGIFYRRVYNQVKIKGVLLLSSDNTHLSSFEVSVKEVLEVWEAKAFVGTQMPEPGISLDRLAALVTDLQHELDRLKK